MDRQSCTCDHNGGEIEVENISVDEVETKRKDLLPVFGHRRYAMLLMAYFSL